MEATIVAEPIEMNSGGEQDWRQSLLSFGFQTFQLNPRKPHRRYNVIRRREDESYTDSNISAAIATRLRKRYRAEGFRVDLIEVGT